MSKSYSAWLVVGCPFSEFAKPIDEIEELGLDTFPAGNGDMLVGIGIFTAPEYWYVDLPEKYKLEEIISVAFAKFFALTDKIGNLYLTVNVT